MGDSQESGEGTPGEVNGHPAGWVPAGEPEPANDAEASSAEPPDESGDSLDALVRTAFDLLPTQVAVLDGEGTIRHTNRTWAAFGEANDLEGPVDTVGVNYLEVCDGSDDEHADRAAAGIRSVLEGDGGPFSMEYPCHGPDELRWFVMWARGFDRDGERYAVVVHLDVTARKLSELAVERRNAELQAVNRIGELVREIVASLGRATTRAEVERSVCERLTTDGAYAAAAVVDPTPTDDGFTVRERSVAADAGDPPAAAHVDERTAAVVRAALDAGETRVDRERSAPASTDDDRDPAVAAVPLRHREAVYGVLAVTGRRPDAFDEREAAAFDVLGESAGFAVHAVETERFLHADETLELRFRLREDALPFFSSLGAGEDAEVEFSDVVPGGDGAVVVYASVGGVPAAAVESRAADHDAVESVRVIDAGGDEAPGRLEFRYRPPSPVHDVVAAGGAVRSCTVAADGGLLVAEVDDAATMRAVVDAVAGDADLVGKRGRSTADDGPRGGEAAIDAGLTDRQRDALVAAHRGGYYEWPSRDSNAEELAAAMDVAPQTFHEHLRRAEAKVVDRFVEDGLARRTPDPE
ncbi:helix-turn-helix domain-containing protein [Natronomonas salina]|uniref:bacterio-opsin activator domain-containing protein n=1 Tax=Natronomonas salina TaxID=1710540 RepID=UPI0015B5508D|nr:bacterio-opsin activator domain-containing protein [Natronomonas salina]QLD90227.1 helix-turn-helix domain-containing protein [Natronomonas salina]